MAGLDQTSPGFSLRIEGKDIASERLDDRVMSISWDDSTAMVSEMEIELGNSDGELTDSALIEPGNAVDLYLGYGGANLFIARAEIVRHHHMFSRSGDTVRLVAHDRSWRMQKQQVEITGSVWNPQRRRGAGNNQGTPSFGKLDQILGRYAGRYGMYTDISPKFGRVEEYYLQRKGTSDYETIQALANFHSAYFTAQWRFEPKPGWYLVFKDYLNLDNEKKKFSYHDGPDSNIIDVRFDYAVDALASEIEVQYWDQNLKFSDGRIGGWVTVNEERTTIDKRDPAFRGKKNPITAKRLDRKKAESPQDIRLMVAGHAIIIDTIKFENGEQAREAARRWFERYKDNFITVDITLPGVDVKAGDQHELYSPLFGDKYNGDYFFSRVTQNYTSGSWTTSVRGHKVFT